MRSLVIGGSGFLGSNLVRKLSATGHSGVVLDIRAGNEEVENFETVIGEVSSASQHFKTERLFDVIFHLASSSVPGNAHLDVIGDINANVVSSVKLAIDCATQTNAKLIFLSSGGTVYGDAGDKKLVETDPLKPRSVYGAAKLTIETYLQVLGISHNLDYRIVRLANPYGPGQNPRGIQGLVPVFMRKIALGEPLDIWGTGSATRDYIYIDDVVEALIAIANVPKPRRIYNLGSGQGHSVSEMIELIQGVVGKAATVNYLPARDFDIEHNVLDTALLLSDTSWHPTTELPTGLLKTWETIRPML
jgi:UDP-glucose 4-epimerase